MVLAEGPTSIFDDRYADAVPLRPFRARIDVQYLEIEATTNEEIRQALQQRAEEFRDDAPVTAAEAARVILDGVRQDRWRILIGEDARVLDEMVRGDPEGAYEPAFFEALVAKTGWQLGS